MAMEAEILSAASDNADILNKSLLVEFAWRLMFEMIKWGVVA